MFKLVRGRLSEKADAKRSFSFLYKLDRQIKLPQGHPPDKAKTELPGSIRLATDPY